MTEEQLKALDVCVAEKEYICVVCGGTFKNHIARKVKIRTLDSEIDLRPVTEPIDVTFYDAIVCEHCGYSTLFMFTDKKRSAVAIRTIKENAETYKHEESPRFLSGEDALKRFKLALETTQVTGDIGEKAYIHLKTAWIYRSLKDKENEMLHLTEAAKFFEQVYVEETFPICKLDEPTFSYLIASIYYLIENYQSSLQWVGQVLTSKTAITPRLKDRAFDLKVNVQKELKKQEEAEGKEPEKQQESKKEESKKQEPKKQEPEKKSFLSRWGLWKSK